MSKASRISSTPPAVVTALPAIASEPGALAQPAAAHVAALKASLQLRTMELIGLAEDGRLYLWDTGNVQPVDRFETVMFGSTPCIKGGHYVLDISGHAITVHCGAMSDGTVSLQFMCNNGPVLYAPRANVEAILLGRMVRDPAEDAKLLQRLEDLLAAAVARQQAPHRARGAIR